MLRRLGAPKTHHFTVSKFLFTGGRNFLPRRPYGVYVIKSRMVGRGAIFAARALYRIIENASGWYMRARF